MCMFDSQSIPTLALADWSEPRRHIRKTIKEWTRTVILQQPPKITKKASDIRAGEAKIEDTASEEDFKTLISYALISADAEMSSFKMHRLVNLATQAWLEFHGRLEQWKCRFVTNLDEALPQLFNDAENRAKSRRLYPSATTALRLELSDKIASLHQASLLLKGGSWASDIGDEANAVSMTTRSVALRARLLGGEHPDTLYGTRMLAVIYSNQWRLQEAEELQEQALRATKRLYGAEHTYTLISKLSLASTYSSQGRLEEAQELQWETLEILKRERGYEDYLTVGCASDLARTTSSQGRLEEAEQLQLKALDATKRLSGDEHPRTLLIMSSLAQIYQQQGRLQEAEELQNNALGVRRRLLGDTHPVTLENMAGLASVLQKARRWQSSSDLIERCVASAEELYGASHETTVRFIGQREGLRKEWASESSERNVDDVTAERR